MGGRGSSDDGGRDHHGVGYSNLYHIGSEVVGDGNCGNSHGMNIEQYDNGVGLKGSLL